MRIAFVGKGGSGKTTLAALFTHYVREMHKPVLALDADLNMHLSRLLGFLDNPPDTRHLSYPESVKAIKSFLIGNNTRIKSLAHFRKTTPPTRESRLVALHDAANPVFQRCAMANENLRLMVVGSYDEDGIGASCYHNNLAICENLLSHLLDHEGYVVADMVAGVDAFANTLHAQFDLLVLVVEPTKRGIEVFKQYEDLAKNAGIDQHLLVVGNKVRSENDRSFLIQHIGSEKVLGFFGDSEYLRRKDQEDGVLELSFLEDDNRRTLEDIHRRLANVAAGYQPRLEKLWELHLRYVAQDFVRERLGDLSDQIDRSFNLDDHIKRYLNAA